MKIILGESNIFGNQKIKKKRNSDASTQTSTGKGYEFTQTGCSRPLQPVLCVYVGVYLHLMDLYAN